LESFLQIGRIIRADRTDGDLSAILERGGLRFKRNSGREHEWSRELDIKLHLIVTEMGWYVVHWAGK
jgi:hypothetical protein